MFAEGGAGRGAMYVIVHYGVVSKTALQTEIEGHNTYYTDLSRKRGLRNE